jgi:hypothetical protein
MKDIELSVGFKEAGDYIAISKFSTDESTTQKTKSGNSRCEHAYIYDQNIMRDILKLRNLNLNLENTHSMGVSSSVIEDVINLSLTLTDVNEKSRISNRNIFVSSYCVNADEQKVARTIIEYINDLVA